MNLVFCYPVYYIDSYIFVIECKSIENYYLKILQNQLKLVPRVCTTTNMYVTRISLYRIFYPILSSISSLNLLDLQLLFVPLLPLKRGHHGWP